ncbi:MAG: hypothetical protein WC360_04865 [Opitutales bacterium]|jgi:hypothetical protein
MNKSLLIVICDFLLLSMLALARFDKKPPEPARQEQSAASIQQSAAADLTDSLREALLSEEQAREEMARLLAEKAQQMEQQQSRTETLEQEKSRLEGEQERLQRLRDQLEADRQKLISQVSTSGEVLAQTQKEREKLLADMAAAQERQRLLQEQLSKREDALNKAQQDMQTIQQQKHEVERDNAVLATRLEGAQVAQQRLEGEVDILRTEKDAAHQQAARLAQNVGDLAQAQQVSQEAIQQEIRQVTPLSLNTIYDKFRHNRGVLRFNSRESQLLGDGDASYEIYTVFVRDAQGKVYALCESSRTPLRVGRLDGLRSVKAALDLSGARNLGVDSAAFLKADPRVLAIPADEAMVRGSGVEPFLLEDTPFRFSNAVIVTAGGEKYGEVPVRVSPGTTRYIEVQSSIANRLFGSFSPSEGDLVFSQNGNLMGFMVSSNRAVLVSDMTFADTIALGDAFDPAKATATGKSLSAMIPEDPAARSGPSGPSGGGSKR